MHLEQIAPRCECHSHNPRNASLVRALEQVAAEGPWFALGDGETWEDRIHGYLTSPDSTQCACCGSPLEVSEEELAELSRELLAQW